MAEFSMVFPRNYKHLNCAFLFSCNVQTYQEAIAQIWSVRGGHIYILSQAIFAWSSKRRVLNAL